MLEQLRLPEHAAPGFEQLYAEGGMWTTPDQERARYGAAVAGELSRSIERMPGVVDARVHLSLPGRPTALDAPSAQPRASVLVRHARAAPPDERAIRALVAGAVEGLSQERVVVVAVAAPAPAIMRPTFVYLGPLAVERSSAGSLKTLLSAALGINLALALALIWVVRRKRA